MKSIDIVECVASGQGYIEGEIYPIIGWNNGVNIARIDDSGDCIVNTFASGGMGKGTINSFADDGAPSFKGFTRITIETEF